MPSSREMPPRSRIGRDFLFMCGCPPNHPGPFLKVPVLLNSTAVTQILNVLPSKQAFNVEQILDCSNLVAFMIGMSPRAEKKCNGPPLKFPIRRIVRRQLFLPCKSQILPMFRLWILPFFPFVGLAFCPRGLAQRWMSMAWSDCPWVMLLSCFYPRYPQIRALGLTWLVSIRGPRRRLGRPHRP